MGNKRDAGPEQDKLAKLAKKYDERVKATLAAKPGAKPKVDNKEDQNFSLENYNHKTKAPEKTVPKPTYAAAPALTLRSLLPKDYIPEPMDISGGAGQPSTKIDASFRYKYIIQHRRNNNKHTIIYLLLHFRSETIEFVLMMTKKDGREDQPQQQ